MLGPAALAISRKVQVSHAMAAQSVLAVASLATQAHVDVQMPYGQTRPASLFCVTIAESGERKSTSDNEAERGVTRREEELRREYSSAFKAFKVEHGAWAAEKRKIENERNSNLNQRQEALKNLGPEPPPPLQPMLTTGDLTAEGLVKNWPNMRSLDLSSRKEISNAVGVTPALISYYFPRGVNLADLILSPVILSHLHRTNEIIDSALAAEEKLREVADLLICAFKRDRNLFDAYSVMLHSCNPPEENLLEDFRTLLGILLRECERAGCPTPYPISVQHGAFWGMCRAAADLDVDIPVEELLSLPLLAQSPRRNTSIHAVGWLGTSSGSFAVPQATL